jgi:hypothetical protein
MRQLSVLKREISQTAKGVTAVPPTGRSPEKLRNELHWLALFSPTDEFDQTGQTLTQTDKKLHAAATNFQRSGEHDQHGSPGRVAMSQPGRKPRRESIR